MIKRNNQRTLREIVFEYPIILIDNTVLCNSYCRPRKALTFFEEKEIELKEQYQFRDLLIDYIETGMPCFITSLVSKEYLRGNYPYKKIIKNENVQRNRRVLNFCRQKKDSSKGRRKLIGVFQENNKILDLNEEEYNLYNNFYRRYPKLLSYKLSDVDLDILISGMVVSQTRGPAGLVSNDFGIVRAWKYSKKKTGRNNKKLSFFIKLGMNCFKELY